MADVDILFTKTATADKAVKRGDDGESGFVFVDITALGGSRNLGFRRDGVYAVTGNIVIDNQAINGVYYGVTCTSANIVITLPTASSYAGQELTFKKLDSTTKTVGAFTADGITVTLYEQNESITITSDGTVWKITGRYNPNEPLQQTVIDGGNGTAIPVTRSGHCDLVSAGAETRTLAAPTWVGQQLLLCMKTDGGDITLSCATFLNQAGNNTAVFGDVGDTLLLVAVRTSTNIRWRVAMNDTLTLSTV